MKSQIQPIQRMGSTEIPKYHQQTRHTQWNARRIRFCQLFQESWMTKSCNGSQEVQKHWQAGTLLQQKTSLLRIRVFNNPSTFPAQEFSFPLSLSSISD